MQFTEVYLHTYKLERGCFFCYYFTKMLGHYCSLAPPWEKGSLNPMTLLDIHSFIHFIFVWEKSYAIT